MQKTIPGKGLAALALSIALLSLLSACGGEGKGQPSPGGGPAADQQLRSEPTAPSPDAAAEVAEAPAAAATTAAAAAAVDPSATELFSAKILRGDPVAGEADASRYEAWADELANGANLDETIERFEAAARQAGAPPGVAFALAALYGRKGLAQRSYEALETAEKAAAARPDIVFNLAVVYGRKATAKAAGEDLMRGRLEALSVPPGARIFIDEEERGLAPLTLEGVAAGRHALRFELAGYEPAARSFELLPRGSARVEAALVALPGSIRVATSPPGASVTLAGLSPPLPSQESPAAFEGLAARRYLVSIEPVLDGKLFLTAGAAIPVDLRPGERAALDRKLEEGYGSLRIADAPRGSELVVEGRSMGMGDLPAGQRTLAGLYLDFALRGAGGEEWRGSYSVKPGESTSTSLQLLVYSMAARTIRVDGKPEDWAPTAPVFADPAGDKVQEGSAGTDLVAGYVCRDKDYLYWRLDFADGKPAFAAGDAYQLSLELSGSPSVLLEVARDETGTRSLVTSQNGKPAPAGDFAVGEATIEARFPISAIPAGFFGPTINLTFSVQRKTAGSPWRLVDSPRFGARAALR